MDFLGIPIAYYYGGEVLMNKNEYNLTMWIRLFIICTLAFFFYNVANAKTLKVAVIDTGFDFNGKWNVQPKVCDTGHKDFTGTGLNDTHGHGTHIAGLIAQYAGDVDYCLVVLKFYDNRRSGLDNITATIEAIEYATSLGVDIINYSGGGELPNSREQQAVTNALNKGILFIAAAGNEHANLDDKTYYPAMYDKRIIVISAKDSNGKRLPTSNYGSSVDAYEFGKDIKSILPNSRYGDLTGTSQATAIITGKIVNNYFNQKR